MTELALARRLARTRRRKPKLPRWWVCLVMLALFAALAVWDAAEADWLSLASAGCNGVVWWRALHSPPRYWDSRAFLLWWPPAMLLTVAAVVTS